MAQEKINTCRKCGAPLEWIKTPAGKFMPVNPGRINIVTKEGRVVYGNRPHWATCPNADEFKKND